MLGRRIQIARRAGRKTPRSMAPTTKSRPSLPGWILDLLERHLAEEVELPLLPEACTRILALCEDERADAKSIEGLLERDPSLASHVLRVANSSAYASQEPIVSLQQAVSRLGMQALRNIVLGFTVKGRVFHVPGHQTRVRAVWVHCAVTAAYAREIARMLRRNVEAAFLCGLLHDVARPVVLQATLDTLAHRSKEALPAAFLEATMDELHEQVGARMVGTWKLAEWTVAVVAHHHDPEKAEPHEEQAHITWLADRLAHWAVGPDGPEAFQGDDPVIDRLNLYPEDLDALLAYRGKALEFSEAFD